jgi:hypothetical protein
MATPDFRVMQSRHSGRSTINAAMSAEYGGMRATLACGVASHAARRRSSRLLPLRDLHKLAHHRITSSNRPKGSLAVVHQSLDRPKRQPWRLGWRRADNITNGDFIGATAGADERRRQAAAAPRLNTGPVPAHPAQKPSRKLAPSPTSSCSISSTRRVVRFTRQSRHSAGAGNESNTDRTVGTLSTPAPLTMRGAPRPQASGRRRLARDAPVNENLSTPFPLQGRGQRMRARRTTDSGGEWGEKSSGR